MNRLTRLADEAVTMINKKKDGHGVILYKHGIMDNGGVFRIERL